MRTGTSISTSTENIDMSWKSYRSLHLHIGLAGDVPTFRVSMPFSAKILKQGLKFGTNSKAGTWKAYDFPDRVTFVMYVVTCYTCMM